MTVVRSVLAIAIAFGFIAKEAPKWAEVIKSSGMKLEQERHD